MPDNDSCIDLHYLYPQVPPFTVTGGDYYRLARYSTLGKLCQGEVLPADWTGLCSLVHLGMPFTLIQHQDMKLAKREKRATPSGSFDDKVYIDNIGVPRGVPDEFKARNQILAGLELSISGWSTLNKNMDWINYIYYSQQRFINYTRDAIKDLAEQTEATSLMAWQNIIALDMLLDEKGGLCVIFRTMFVLTSQITQLRTNQ
ncbi:unnamed protein product [Oncorhynchus mykiss]|uniref:Uncharacterized protein n=1 Tax=Oncorhynchus mykiss TaxID=8022 RepID=A0A060Z176_ONCMY|nr:unnamed protein product [Oncorhynchus mykiss]